MNGTVVVFELFLVVIDSCDLVSLCGGVYITQPPHVALRGSGAETNVCRTFCSGGSLVATRTVFEISRYAASARS